ncbi:YgjV family protein [Neisseriaceae bacterium ESL0693]|nr:YgjV family protein [Neisseriaceae bacterium ESL0693]
MNLADVLGYTGTVLVILSFLCNSLIKLRILNAIGAFLVTIYAIMNHAWPVALLDGFIVIINVFQLFKNKIQI